MYVRRVGGSWDGVWIIEDSTVVLQIKELFITRPSLDYNKDRPQTD